MHLVTHDWESFWSPTHSLTKMNPFAYVMHPDTEIISLSLAINDDDPIVVFGEDEAVRLLRWAQLEKALLIAHNNEGFDALMTGLRLGFKPAMWGCTLAMARPIFAKTVGVSLKRVSEALGVGVKNDAVLHETKGKRLADFTPGELARMRTYNGEDTVLCRGVFHQLRHHFSPEEMFHIDCNIRMVADPKYVADMGVLEAGLKAERARKWATIHALAKHMQAQYRDLQVDWNDNAAVLEFVSAEMSSAPKFSRLLESRGVEVPMKPSPTPPKDGEPRKMIPALSKTDEDFTALVEHEDELVAAAAQARLDVKSTITETRIETLLGIAPLVGGRIPAPIKIYGADTTGRDSGWLYNVQNFPRVNPKAPKPSDALRGSLTAPPGYLIGVADQSGVELRMTHWFCGVPDTAARYAEDPKADLYREFASYYYGKPPSDISGNERQFGKVSLLLLQFGSAAATFRKTARTQYGVRMDLPTAESGVTGFRTRYPDIVDMWGTGNNALGAVSRGQLLKFGPDGIVSTDPEGLRLPSGRMIRYPDLRYVKTDETWDDGRPRSSWVYGSGRNTTYVYGAKCIQNIIQALARDSVFECAFRFFKLTGFRPVMRLHDELIYMFPKSEAEALLAELQRVMRTPPSWGPTLVLWSEGDVAERYSDAK